MKPIIKLCCTLLVLLHSFTKAESQNIYTDSLENFLQKKDISKPDVVVVLCKLARANFETDLQKSFVQANRALDISRELPDGQGKAWAYATLIHLYVQKKDIKNAYESRDSALFYSGKTKNSIAKGFVSFRSGWFDMINDENNKAIGKFLEALEFFNGQNAEEYESMIYHYLSSFYGFGNNPVKQANYARSCYLTAIKSKQIYTLNTAYYTLGQSFYDQFKLDKDRSKLDSALILYKKALLLSKQQAGRLLILSNTAGVALNTANCYFQHFPNTYRDSVIKYIDIAEGIAEKVHLYEVLLNCYGMRSEYEQRGGNYDAAEKILLAGLGKIEQVVIKMPVTKARIYLSLSKIAEKRGNQQAALNYLKKYIGFYKKGFDEEKVSIIQKTDAAYQSKKKEEEIARLKEQALFNKRKNLYYFTLGVAGLIVLLLLLNSYNLKLKASVRKQKLIDKEKTEAELQAQLKEVEALRLQTEQALLKERQERLQNELLAGTLQIEEKNELLNLLSDKITVNSNLPVNEQIRRVIDQQKRMDKDFEDHKTDFVEINPVVFERLQQKANQTLTRLDLKHCTYILMGMSNKEVSIRLNIESKSILMARYRLKQKFGLAKKDNLDHFIRSQKY